MDRHEYEVDFDGEAVWLDGAWYTRDRLVQRIQAMIEQGDYRISRPSAALERLEAALGGARILAARVEPELAQAYEQAAEELGRPLQTLIREALGWWLQARAQAQGQPPAEAPQVVEAHVPLDDPEIETNWLGK